jgi:lipid-binding SYLF domain-containing protein
MIHEAKRRLLRVAVLSLVALPGLYAWAQQQPGAPARKASEPQETCQPEAALEAQVTDAEAAVERIFVGPGDERTKVRAVAENAFAVIVFPHVAKVGFFVSAAQGKGLLSYRDADGHWSHPVVVSGRITSVGPHFSMQTIDMMIVARTREALLRVLTGRPPGQTGAEQGAQIVTYSRTGGLTAGLSLDDYQITIDQEANQGLYCRPILAEEIVREGHKVTAKPPPCAQKFVQTMNRAAGKAPITRTYQ